MVGHSINVCVHTRLRFLKQLHNTRIYSPNIYFVHCTHCIHSTLYIYIYIYICRFVIYVGFTLFLFVEQLVRGNLQQFKTDSILFDIWTIIHFLAGPFFALVLPFIWMFIVVTAWEIMEALTFGFGESEVIGNRIVDIVVALVGWWIIVLIFKRTRTDIPWISSMNAAGNGGEEINWPWFVNKISCGACCKDAASSTDEKDVSEQMEYNNNNTKDETQQTEVEL